MSLRRAFLSCRLMTLFWLAAWFVASNHCALGLMSNAGPEHRDCCAPPTKSGVPVDHAPVKDCCQTRQGLLPAVDKTGVAPAPLAGAPVGPMVVASAWWPHWPPVVNSGFVTGPPGQARSFAESVLQRSLRSHAPPLQA